MPMQASAILKFSDAEARLFLRAKRVTDGGREIDLDQMIVRHTDGREETMFVYDRGGERKLGRMKPATTAPGAMPSYSDVIEPLSPEKEKKMWGIYDRLLINAAA